MTKYISLALAALTIVFFKNLQLALMEGGVSWTLSFTFPYFLLAAFGLLLGLIFRHDLARFSRVLRFVILLVLIVLPFGIGFALHPIYEGDYTAKGTALTKQNLLANAKDADFVVLTIPNCPFCRESTEKISRLQRRNPTMRIKYVVCANDPAATKELRGLLDKRIRIELASSLSEALMLSGGKFPTFLRTEKGKAVEKWNNKELGMPALDRIESSLN